MLWTMVLKTALTLDGALGVVAAFALFSFWAGQCLSTALTCVFHG